MIYFCGNTVRGTAEDDSFLQWRSDVDNRRFRVSCGSEAFGGAGRGDFDLWNLSGLLWIERQALCRKCYKYVYDCRDYECGR